MAASSSLLLPVVDSNLKEEKASPIENPILEEEKILPVVDSIKEKKTISAICFDKKNWSEDRTPFILKKIKIDPQTTGPILLLSFAELEPLEAKRSDDPVEYNNGIFKTLEEYQQCLLSNNITSSIDPYSIADTVNGMPAGSHLLSNSINKSVNHPNHYVDYAGIRRFYAKMHRTALRSPTDDVDLHLVITTDGLIGTLANFFRNPLLRPRNIEVYFYKYNGQELEYRDFLPRNNSPKTHGAIDYNYQRTVQNIHPEYKRNSEGDLEITNSDDEQGAILYFQNTISSRSELYVASLLEKARYATTDGHDSILAQLQDPTLSFTVKEKMCADIACTVKAAAAEHDYQSFLFNFTLNDILFLKENNIPINFQLGYDYIYHLIARVKLGMSPEEIVRTIFLPNTTTLPILNKIAFYAPNRFKDMLIFMSSKSINVPDRIAELLVMKSNYRSSFQQFIYDVPELFPAILEQIKLSKIGPTKLAEALPICDKENNSGLHDVLKCVPNLLPDILEQIKLSKIGPTKLAEALRIYDKENNSGLHDVLKYAPNLLPDILTVLGESPLNIDYIARAFIHKGTTGCGLHDVLNYAPQHFPLLMSKVALHPEGAQFILQALTVVDAAKQSGKDAVKLHKDVIVNAFIKSLTNVSHQQLQALRNDLTAAVTSPTATYGSLCQRANPFVSQLFAKTTLWKQLDDALSQEIERRKSAPARSLTFVHTR